MGCLLETRAVSKAFGGIQALDRVNFHVAPGEVVGLLGENGAGKSTLMRILCGLEAPDSGEILVDSQSVTGLDPHKAQSLGIGMIPQELLLVDGQSVMHNIFLGRELSRAGRLNRTAMRKATKEILESLGCDHIHPDTTLGKLPKAEQQLVAIARRILQGGRVFIMDEPTSALTARETEKLFAVVRRLCRDGGAVVYISHRLEEVLEICDRFAILRDGAMVANLANGPEIGKRQLVSEMIGADVEDEFPHLEASIGEELLRVKDLSYQTDQGQRLQNISFSLRAGEVLGITGLVGVGKSELAQTLMGLRRADSGTIWVNQVRRTINSPAKARSLGIGYVTEDRRGEGLVLGMRSLYNMTLSALKRVARFGVVQQKHEKEIGREYAKYLNMKPIYLDLAAQKLSGGNQQKVVVIRQMMSDSQIILFDEPTKGIDVGAKAEIARLIGRLSQEGKGICVFSSEPREVLGVSDRILVFSVDGSLHGPFDRGKLDYQTLMALEFGAAEEEALV